MYSCPYCHKQVKDLKSHLKRVHPDKVTEKPPDQVKPAARKLELEVPRKPKLPKETEVSKSYHCIDCGGALTEGQANCPSCGVTLDWSAL